MTGRARVLREAATRLAASPHGSPYLTHCPSPHADTAAAASQKGGGSGAACARTSCALKRTHGIPCPGALQVRMDRLDAALVILSSPARSIPRRHQDGALLTMTVKT